MNNINEYISNEGKFISVELLKLLDNNDSIVNDAIRYSSEAGGKRIRPLLTLEFSKLLNGDRDDAIKFGCAVEMIHTYSLIHDDLPCMDNDDMRRGKPSCHIKYGYDNALLAGDALQTKAFNVIASAKNISPENVVKAVAYLSELSGINGMVGGQVLDLQFENHKPDLNNIIKMYSLKTCALIKASCVLGCLTSNKCDDKTIASACSYAENLGIAFQIVDDILDIEGDEQLFGKPIGSDNKNNKTTVISYLGLKKAKDKVIELTNEAISSLDSIEGNTETLKSIALFLINRKF